jgi:Branched-chain amino acid transport system / permease component
MLFWMVIVVAVPAYILLSHSRWGRYLFAIGSNKEAARLSGVNVKAMRPAVLTPPLRGDKRVGVVVVGGGFTGLSTAHGGDPGVGNAEGRQRERWRSAERALECPRRPARRLLDEAQDRVLS